MNNLISALHPNMLPALMRNKAFGHCSCHVNQMWILVKSEIEQMRKGTSASPYFVGSILNR